MQLTMYMALDALSGFAPEPEITDGECRLSGPSLGGGSGAMTLLESGDGVLVKGGSDRIRVRGQSLAAVHDTLTEALAVWNGWERRLLAAATEGSPQSVVDAAYTLFDEPIFITDARDHICAITPHPRGTVNEEWDYILDHGCMPADTLLAIYRDPAFRRESGRPGAPFIFNPPGMLHRGINMRFQDPESGDWLGVAVVIEHSTPITIGKLHLAESLYEALCLNLRLHPAAVAAQTEAALMQDLFHGGAAPERAQLLAARLFPGVSRFAVAIVRSSAARPAQHGIPVIEKLFPGARILIDGHALCVLLPYCGDASEKLCGAAEQIDAHIGLSRPFSDWSRMGEYREQARMALETGCGRVNELTGRSVNALCAKVLREQLSGLALAHPALPLLAAYDARHHSALMPTLEAYLLNERNLVRTAAALYIHRNSLVYRIRRITELSGLSLDDPDERLYLLYSFAMLAGGDFPARHGMLRL